MTRPVEAREILVNLCFKSIIDSNNSTLHPEYVDHAELALEQYYRRKIAGEVRVYTSSSMFDFQLKEIATRIEGVGR